MDGSDVDDWTAIRAETIDGYQFTPRVLGGRPSIWNPAQHVDHRIPRDQVSAAVDEIFDRFAVERMYCDPPYWPSEIEGWSLKHGERRVLKWETRLTTPMHHALERFVTDLGTRAITHDGCPDTTNHMASAVKKFRGRDQYGLAKASRLQKIDAAVTSVLAHEAACDARAAGWGKSKPRKNARMIVIR